MDHFRPVDSPADVLCPRSPGPVVHTQGKVSDTNGNPIELASVMVVSQGKLAMTNLKGEFSLELHSADSVAVRFSMVGYRTKTRVLRRRVGARPSWSSWPMTIRWAR